MSFQTELATMSSEHEERSLNGLQQVGLAVAATGLTAAAVTLFPVAYAASEVDHLSAHKSLVVLEQAGAISLELMAGGATLVGIGALAERRQKASSKIASANFIGTASVLVPSPANQPKIA